jgi:hypothetical protein
VPPSGIVQTVTFFEKTLKKVAISPNPLWQALGLLRRVMKLYKFKSLSGDSFLHSLDMIVNERIFLANCESMNDPEEGAWDVSNVPVNDEYLENAEKIRKLVDAVRFTSFTQNYDNELLWAHYAGGFAGICFEYEIETTTHDILPILYAGKPTLTDENVIQIAEKTIRLQDAGILLSKSKCWFYEKEYRLFSNANCRNNFLSIKPQKVIFGCRGLKYDCVFKQITKKYGIPFAYLSKNRDEFSLVDM